MAQPVWVTQAGNLGTIPEGIFYQVSLQAYDPADPNNPDLVYYVMIAGELPAGVQCTKTGLIVGIPQAIASLQGVPTEVARNVTSKFAVRAYTERVVNGVVLVDRIADRTFTLTVTGQDAPKFVTPSGNIGTFYDGSPIAPIQIQISNTDPGETIVISVAAGELPPGLTISTTGLISGYIIPLVPVTQEAGFSRDGQGFDQYPFDFASNSISTNYQFTLEVTDGKESDIRTYEIYVYGKSSMTADTTFLTTDNTFVTADVSPDRVPFLINAVPSDLGTVRSDNFWAYQFIGEDFDGDVIEYVDYQGDSSLYTLPPGTTLDTFSGWLYGYLPDMGATEQTYTFALILRKTNNPDLRSDPYVFTLTVVGQVDTDVVWLTPADLGTIDNGAISLLKVEAVNTGGRSLQYKLEPGSYPSPNIGVFNRLPQGTQLLPSGDIAGRVSFNTFALDLGTTTFDKNLRTRLSADETTFDMSCTFTVNAFSVDGLVSVYKTFTVMVVRAYNEPYENLYIKAMPPFADRALVNQLIQNTDIFPPDLIFRPADPNFGISTSVIYDHCFGLTSSTYELYMSSLYKNHYWKNLVLGEIKTAQALDASGNIIYEVVYSAVQDGLVNSQGISVSKQVTLPYPISPGDSSEITTVYPNSLPNMRDQVIDVVGQISNILPLWMLSKQTNGQVLGFTPAWVITYCKPGTSGQIAYNIQSKYGTQLNRVDFEVDRYELDRLLSYSWDPVADSSNGAWIPTPAETTFDLVLHYELTAFANAGTGYKIGDRILILGSQIGGQDVINNLVVVVQDINATTGAITIVNLRGQAPLFSSGDTFTNITGTNLIGTGSSAAFNFVVASGEITTFDATSMRFEAPVDIYTSTDAYDKYLVFPQRNILV
jgi:hypothetical protein